MNMKELAIHTGLPLKQRVFPPDVKKAGAYIQGVLGVRRTSSARERNA